jgi:hypothetical protein
LFSSRQRKKPLFLKGTAFRPYVTTVESMRL